jgi:hypothetical protein
MVSTPILLRSMIPHTLPPPYPCHFAAFTSSFCTAAVQLTYTCMSNTIADRRGAVTPVCVHLSNMIDALCQGYPWRTMLGSGSMMLTPAPGAHCTPCFW